MKLSRKKLERKNQNDGGDGLYFLAIRFFFFWCIYSLRQQIFILKLKIFGTFQGFCIERFQYLNNLVKKSADCDAFGGFVIKKKCLLKLMGKIGF